MSPSRSRVALASVVLLALSGLLVSGSAEGQGVCDPSLPGCIDPRAFQVRAYGGQIVKNGGKCLDYTPEVVGSPVFLNDCSMAHPVGVSELSERMGADGRPRKHEVRLRAGTKFLGFRPSPEPGAEVLLEVQDDLSFFRGSRRTLNNQTFSLDGDSIIVAADRDPAPGRNLQFSEVRVVRVQNSRGANGSPIVVGPRQINDSEFWEFHAIDNSGRDPTTGFVRVSGLDGLVQYFGSITQPPDFDTVIVVQSGPIILSTNHLPLGPLTSASLSVISITEGVTIRGDRRGTRLGVELAIDSAPNDTTLLDILGSHARVTGLRIRGTSEGQDEDLPKIRAIRTRDDFVTAIDNNDLSAWTDSDVEVNGPDGTRECTTALRTRIPPDRVRVVRNFLHHNQRWGSGYGVVMSRGGNAGIFGNTFLNNRHAIADDGTTLSGYRAWFNLVLHDTPFYVLNGGAQQDFDMHGGVGGYGGYAGHIADIAWNTFFGDDRYNYELRGTPCTTPGAPHSFSYNATLRHEGGVLRLHQGAERFAIRYDGGVAGWGPILFVRVGNLFEESYSDPTKSLGVGDFDGDRIEDLFLATRTAWFYSPGGVAEWRFLAGGRTDRREDLRFGDFDGDGRTDVLGKNGSDLMVSWGGASDWEKLNSNHAPITDLAVGNFDGIGGDDIFWATGRTWYVSAGGSGPWLPSGPSSFRVRDVLFGDFNRNGKTDVFGVVSGQWSYSDGTTVGWVPLRPALTDDVAGLFVADFDGDGTADIGSVSPASATTVLYRYSLGGIGGWTALTTTFRRPAAVGRFFGGLKSAILFWVDDKLDALYVGSGGFVSHSRQDMF